MDEISKLLTSMQSSLGEGVHLTGGVITETVPSIPDEEWQHVAKASAKRQREFSCGRYFGHQLLGKLGYPVTGVSTLSDARRVLNQCVFNVILLDINLPDGNSLDWLDELSKMDEPVSVIVVTGEGDIRKAVRALKAGADNYLLKPVEMEELEIAIRKCGHISDLRKKESANRRIRIAEEPFKGGSPAMQPVLKNAAIVAESDSVVLIMGETGTGKGVLARWIHENSPRSGSAFVDLNCTALRGEILKSELFGHAKGAFTSAIKDRIGLCEAADGGTLFLDEIGDMDLEVQAQLLKVLEERTFRRLGENRVRTSDFRLICATNQDLAESVGRGTFRRDLFYRLNVFQVTVPPLRERTEDIPGLAAYLLARRGYRHLPLCPEVTKWLQERHWAGNIRELKNLIERAVLLAQGDPINLSHFPLEIPKAPAGSTNASGLRSLDEIELEHIQKALAYHRGDKVKTSKSLGISLSSLYRKIPQLQESD